MSKWTQQSMYFTTLLSMLVPISAAFLATAAPDASARLSEQFSPSDAWTTYLADTNHDGFNNHETLINLTSAPQLKQKWAHPTRSGISDQPIESAGIVYWGSWDGYMHATNVSDKMQEIAHNVGVGASRLLPGTAPGSI